MYVSNENKRLKRLFRNICSEQKNVEIFGHFRFSPGKFYKTTLNCNVKFRTRKSDSGGFQGDDGGDPPPKRYL